MPTLAPVPLDSSTLRFRFLRPGEIHSLDWLIEQERPSFLPSTFKVLPAILEDLLERERVTAMVTEDRNSVHSLGIGGFVHPGVMKRATGNIPYTLRENLMSWARAGEPVFLSRKQEAIANAEGSLIYVGILACQTSFDFEIASSIFRMTFQAFSHSYAGYRMAELWNETLEPNIARFMAGTGGEQVWNRRLPGGHEALLFRFLASNMNKTPGNPMASLLAYPQPMLNLTLGQQRLLLHVLLGEQDEEIAEKLDLTADAIKKRWRGIYQVIGERLPSLIPQGAGAAEKRRLVVAHLQQHLEELRPYDSAAQERGPLSRLQATIARPATANP